MCAAAELHAMGVLTEEYLRERDGLIVVRDYVMLSLPIFQCVVFLYLLTDQ